MQDVGREVAKGAARRLYYLERPQNPSSPPSLPSRLPSRLSLRKRDQKEPADDRQPLSAGTARAITRNHGSYYKTVPEGEFSCPTPRDLRGGGMEAGGRESAETRGIWLAERLDRGESSVGDFAISKGSRNVSTSYVRARPNYVARSYGSMAGHVVRDNSRARVCGEAVRGDRVDWGT